MRYIQKKAENPESLDRWVERKRKAFANKDAAYQWGRFQKSKEKRELQDILLHEQGHLCAYCNRRIHKGSPNDDQQMRMDHLRAKHLHIDKLFDYQNIVGSCFGGERGKPPKELHCEGLKRFGDKEEQELPEALLPTVQRCEAYTVYPDGRLVWDQEHLHAAMVKLLNLNCTKLKSIRAAVLADYIDGMADLSEDELQAEIELTLTPEDNGQMEALAGVIANFLRQQI